MTVLLATLDLHEDWCRHVLDDIQPSGNRVWFLDPGQTVSPESERWWRNSQLAIEFGAGLLTMRVAERRGE